MPGSFLGKGNRKNGHGVCRNAKDKWLLSDVHQVGESLSLGSSIENHSNLLWQTSAVRESSGRLWECMQDQSKGKRLGLKYSTVKWENTCPGFATTSWLHIVGWIIPLEEIEVLLGMDYELGNPLKAPHTQDCISGPPCVWCGILTGAGCAHLPPGLEINEACLSLLHLSCCWVHITAQLYA